MKNTKLNYCIFFILLSITALSASCSNQPGVKNTYINPVDTSIYYKLDVDYDSVADELSLNFHGASLKSPFTWTFEIKSAEKPIFKVSRNDKNLDEFFSDTLYTGNCSDYIECKTKFYFETLPEMIFKRKTVPEKIDYPSLEPAVIPFLTDSLKLDPATKMKVLDEFKKRIESGNMIILPVILSPAINDHPVTWSSTLNRMVTILWD